jgi:hypothetical protein
MSLSIRHARYVIGMAAGVLCVLLLLVSQVHPPTYLSQSHVHKTEPRPSPRPPHILTPIQSKLVSQEEGYYEMIQKRHTLIRKFGPTPEKLQP